MLSPPRRPQVRYSEGGFFSQVPRHGPEEIPTHRHQRLPFVVREPSAPLPAPQVLLVREFGAWGPNSEGASEAQTGGCRRQAGQSPLAGPLGGFGDVT